MKTRIPILLFVFAEIVSVWGEVLPAGIFTDHAVLQQGQPVRIWGTAAPKEIVTVSFAGQTEEAVADESGKWMVSLKKMPACADGRSLILQGSETKQPVELKDVLVGEVWLAGGQSNMQTTMQFYKETTQADMDSANDPLLRMVTIPDKFYEGQNNSKPVWKPTHPGSIPGFSASAYYFAKNLRSTLQVPVGIVACSVGGTPAEAWMSRETLASSPELKRILDAYDSHFQKTFGNEQTYLEKVEEEKNAARQEKRRVEIPMGPHHLNRPCGLHENMLTQTIPYSIRGVIWYQGENNARLQNCAFYRTVFSALIGEWRKEFLNESLPFLFVQLATVGSAQDRTPYWPELRDSQKWAEEHIENTGMVVLTDGGESNNIHPHSKDKVGYRLSLLARNMVYGEKDLLCHGPRLTKAIAEKGAVELSFKDTGSGLVLKPEAESAFEICGKDGKYVPAKAELVNGKIIVSAESVPDPEFVRYGWRTWFVPTLFNQEGLPASPFKTDNFPMITEGRFYLDRF